MLVRLIKPGDSAELNAAFLPSNVGKGIGLFRQVESGPPGFLTFGPYINLSPGRYSFKIFYHAEGEEDKVAHWDVNVSGPGNDQVIKVGDLPRQLNTVKGSFQLAEPGNIQIRTFYEGHGKLTVEKISISKIE